MAYKPLELASPSLSSLPTIKVNRLISAPDSLESHSHKESEKVSLNNFPSLTNPQTLSLGQTPVLHENQWSIFIFLSPQSWNRTSDIHRVKMTFYH